MVGLADSRENGSREHTERTKERSLIMNKSYAADGIVAEPYDREMLDQAWKFKKK